MSDRRRHALDHRRHDRAGLRRLHFAQRRRLYTSMIYGPSPMWTSSEDDGATWVEHGTHQFGQGPFELGFDATNRILYTASWNDGLWALALPQR